MKKSRNKAFINKSNFIPIILCLIQEYTLDKNVFIISS